MAATTTFRLTEFAGLKPTKGTLEQAANTLIIGGTIVTVDADGRADVVTPGQNAIGVALADSDNRTTAPEGGAAGAIKCQVQYGVFGFDFVGNAPAPGDVVYVADNQTVSTDSDSGTRGIAGYCSETIGSTCYVEFGPTVAGQIVIAATEAAQLDTAQADIDNLQTDVAMGRIDIPLGSARLANGTAPGAFTDGSADGFVVDEGVMYRWNVASTTPIWFDVVLPPELDASAAVEVHALCSREGADDETVVLTVGAYFQRAGAAYDADENAGGASTPAIAGATKVITETVATIAAADVPAGPCKLSISLVPSAALDADDLNLHALWIEHARALTA